MGSSDLLPEKPVSVARHPSPCPVHHNYLHSKRMADFRVNRDFVGNVERIQRSFKLDHVLHKNLLILLAKDAQDTFAFCQRAQQIRIGDNGTVI